MEKGKTLGYREVEVRGGPRFVARFNWPNKSLRAYVHVGGLEYFGGGTVAGAIQNARQHLIDVVKNPLNFANGPEGMAFRGQPRNQHMIAAVWNNEEPMIDFFKFCNGDKWPGNPEMYNYVFRSGIYRPEAAVTCGDGLIILGVEEQDRRRAHSLRVYLENPPVIKGIKLGVDEEITDI